MARKPQKLDLWASPPTGIDLPYGYNPAPVPVDSLVGKRLRIACGWYVSLAGEVFSRTDGIMVKVASEAPGERTYGWREDNGRLVGFFLSDVIKDGGGDE